ncbi:MAG: ammonium transporter [Chloroflexi bacterium]|nr:ammonium transporter [Chloroflexota bacterium]MCI0580967.1 ammonium transporter [Chloroflexota bacterium]MCI0645361.1 ammonium transporter [Chloroflexota bacterium]MCI0729303.1 ammonium transporter [Chloroflexota bacterium]
MMRFAKLHRWFIPVLALLALLLAAGTAFAQDEQPLAETTADTVVSLNVLWVLLAGFLVFFMQAGFALVETGFTRAKNVAHTMMMNMMVFCIGAIGYWLTGFALQFGGVNHTYPEISSNLPAWAFSPVTMGDWSGLLDKPLLIGGSGFMGLTGFMLAGLSANFGVLAFFLFQMVFMDTAATIPTGSMAERLKFVGFALMGMWVSMFIYPLVGGWVWGGGWLANLGRTAGLGNGAVDFAGSGVVHMIGGSLALAGAIVLGPRLGRFNKDGSPNPIPGHNIPMGVLGTIILFFGWFGFNPGSALGFTGAFRNLAVLAAVNTLLAGAAGGVSAMLYMWLISPTRKPDPGLSVNGILAGLVAITAPCAFVSTTAAVVIGLVAGVLVCLATVWLEKARIDDAVGAVPVHFVNGMWGVLAVGIFANGNPDTALWNGVDTPVTGLLYGGGTQILAQLAEVIAIAVTVLGLSLVFFKVLNAFGLLRVSQADELAGLDLPEMGVKGYVESDGVALPGVQMKEWHFPAAGNDHPARVLEEEV